MNQQQYRQQLQHIANEHHTKIYIYVLDNGNRFSTPDPMGRSEKVGGAKIDKLIEVIKPQSISQ